MAEELEAAQKALRRMDYDSPSESEDDKSQLNSFAGPMSTSSVRQRGRSVRSHDSLEPSSFDPFAPATTSNTGVQMQSTPQSSQRPPNNSLFDDISVDQHRVSDDYTKATSSRVPGAAGYLEMETEPPRNIQVPTSMTDEPIRTSSGLQLTHRRSPIAKRPPTSFERDANNPHLQHSFRNAQKDYFEVENGYYGRKADSNRGTHSMPMVQARRFLSYVRIWMVISAVFLVAATGVLFHSFGHTEAVSADGTVIQQANIDNQRSVAAAPDTSNQVPNQIILIPMDNISEIAQQQQQQLLQQESPNRRLSSHHNKQPEEHGIRRVLHEARQEFETWVAEHGKQYHSKDEKEHRFNVWRQNHHRTIEKNLRHGPCKLTKQTVFGSNHLMDLTPQEFKLKFLTGYKGLRTDELEMKRKEMPHVRKLSPHSGKVLNPRLHKPKMHNELKQRMLQQQQPIMTTRNASCSWYDISCFLRWLWQSAGIQFGSIIGTMEPKYNSDTYPNAIDWRNYGAVTAVRSQGDCGACWAITAVESVESAHFIATGDLYDLSEAEIITCEDSCSMCSGGWPQNAFEWVMDHGGLPLYNNFPYNGSRLLAMTQGIEGTSYSWTEDSVKAYRQEVCPASDGSNSQDSNDGAYYEDDGKENENYGDYSDQGRYGNIKGYGYVTDRCICYSDGSGCDCDDQDEDLAVGNIASYGPAVVCLEASLWQDYSGGIITSDLGCGSTFLDMNHCVQVVGYAFTTGSDDENGDGENGDKENGDNSGSNSGSQDSSEREGYWIVRNQWGSNWGMSGYAYVAMGENTCGVLNDMTQAYLE